MGLRGTASGHVCCHSPQENRKYAPLYVALHWADHDGMSCVNGTPTVGNHDIRRDVCNSNHRVRSFRRLRIGCR